MASVTLDDTRQNKLESFFGINLSNTTFWRNSKMQNGRFPNTSFGESEKQNFLADQYEDLGGVFGEGA